MVYYFNMERRLYGTPFGRVNDHSLAHRVSDSFTLYRRYKWFFQFKFKSSSSIYSTGVLLRVRNTRISAVYLCLHDVSLPICTIVIANDIITCELTLINYFTYIVNSRVWFSCCCGFRHRSFIVKSEQRQYFSGAGARCVLSCLSRAFTFKVTEAPGVKLRIEVPALSVYTQW